MSLSPCPFLGIFLEPESVATVLEFFPPVFSHASVDLGVRLHCAPEIESFESLALGKRVPLQVCGHGVHENVQFVRFQIDKVDLHRELSTRSNGTLVENSAALQQHEYRSSAYYSLPEETVQHPSHPWIDAGAEPNLEFHTATLSSKETLLAVERSAWSPPQDDESKRFVGPCLLGRLGLWDGSQVVYTQPHAVPVSNGWNQTGKTCPICKGWPVCVCQKTQLSEGGEDSIPVDASILTDQILEVLPHLDAWAAKSLIEKHGGDAQKCIMEALSDKTCPSRRQIQQEGIDMFAVGVKQITDVLPHVDETVAHILLEEFHGDPQKCIVELFALKESLPGWPTGICLDNELCDFPASDVTNPGSQEAIDEDGRIKEILVALPEFDEAVVRNLLGECNGCIEECITKLLSLQATAPKSLANRTLVIEILDVLPHVEEGVAECLLQEFCGDVQRCITELLALNIKSPNKHTIAPGCGLSGKIGLSDIKTSNVSLAERLWFLEIKKSFENAVDDEVIKEVYGVCKTRASTFEALRGMFDPKKTSGSNSPESSHGNLSSPSVKLPITVRETAPDRSCLDGGTIATWRDSAADHARLRAEYFQKAAMAFRDGNGHIASDYSARGRTHGRLMREANERASTIIVQNSDLRFTHDEDHNREPQRLDLHGLHVIEAVKAIRERLKQMQCQAGRVSRLQIISGAGNNSVRGTPRLFPVVASYLEQHHYSFTCPNRGQFDVLVRRARR